MSQLEKFRITAKDYATIEEMLEHLDDDVRALAPLLRRRLDDAQVVFGHDIEPDRATLDSRVVFRVNAGPAHTRNLVAQGASGGRKAELSISNPRGIALLGLRAGDSVTTAPPDGPAELLQLDAVLYQPEAERLAGHTAGAAAMADGVPA